MPFNQPWIIRGNADNLGHKKRTGPRWRDTALPDAQLNRLINMQSLPFETILNNDSDGTDARKQIAVGDVEEQDVRVPNRAALVEAV